jgi:hypothetical protein
MTFRLSLSSTNVVLGTLTVLLTWCLSGHFVCGSQNHSRAYPWLDSAMGSPSFIPPKVTCPAGPYLSDIDRRKREAYLSTWLHPSANPPAPIRTYEDGIKWLSPRCKQSYKLSEMRGEQHAYSTTHTYTQ